MLIKIIIQRNLFFFLSGLLLKLEKKQFSQNEFRKIFKHVKADFSGEFKRNEYIN